MINEQEQQLDKSEYPKPLYAWYMVGLLTLGYFLSYLDRYILSLLVEPIKNDFSLSDTQVGLLLGAAFAVFYATMGIPLGWLADNMKRKNLVAIGMLVWSMATCLSGYTKNFVGLFAARAMVGAGEAALSPCAMSIISDMFPEGKRGRAIAVYSCALTIAAATSYYLGAKLLEWATVTDTTGMVLIDGLRPWQVVLVLVGLPGIILSIFMFFTKEPKRRVSVHEGQGEPRKVKFSQTIEYYKENLGAFLGVCLLVSVMTTIVYSQGFIAAMFERTWGWTPSEFGVRYSIGVLVFGPPSILLGGWLIDKLHSDGHQDAGFKVLKIGLYLMVPINFIFPLMPTGWSAMIGAYLGLIGSSLVTAAGVPALLKIIPGQIRGQSVAIYYMIISMCGLLLGPTSVGIISDALGDTSLLRYAVAAIPAFYGSLALLFLPYISRKYKDQIAKGISL